VRLVDERGRSRPPGRRPRAVAASFVADAARTRDGSDVRSVGGAVDPLRACDLRLLLSGSGANRSITVPSGP
jgi:hypothetical protein